MDTTGIFSATLGLSPPWRVTLVIFGREERRLDITVSFDPADNLVCPVCGQPVLPSQGATEVWFHEDFLRFPTYLSAYVPLLRCVCGRQLPVDRPWSRAGSRFDRLH